MSFYDTIELIVNITLIIIILVVLIWFYQEYKANKLNNRVGKYSITSNEKRDSLFDILVNLYLKIRESFCHLLEKSNYLKKYSLKYEKYLDKDNQIMLKTMDYVTTKFLIGLFFIFVLIISTFTQDDEFTISKIIVAFTLGFFSLDIFLQTKNKYIDYVRKNDLLKAITIMNNCFKSGRSIIQTIDIVAYEIDGPLKKEFMKMKEDINYGLEIEEVFKRFNERVKLKDVKYITTSLMILNKTGGNIIDVFSSIEKTIFNNRKLEDEMKNLSVAAKALYRLLIVIPFIFTLIIFILDPTYFMPLFVKPLGLLIIILIITIYVLYIIIVKKIMKLREY